MPGKRPPITVRGYVPKGDGTYLSYEDDLTPEQRRAYGIKLRDAMVDALRRYYTITPVPPEPASAAEAPPKRGGAGGRKRGSEWHR